MPRAKNELRIHQNPLFIAAFNLGDWTFNNNKIPRIAIYLIEENPNYLDVTDAFFQAMFDGEFSVITSVLTITDS
ncbi:MAG: hypothetical protein V7L05_05245 [Nostoc sp.]|uniref:hypothetical protein n=1 Tax=Nostoc sp. TaxID=1180 RepID=UPI002FF84CEF